MPTNYTVSATVRAPIDRIFKLLTEPSEHHRFDATGMVGSPEAADRLTTVGQVFVMNMTYRSGSRVEHYQSDNHVTAVADPHLIEWATATHGGPLLGWLWRYELAPLGDGAAITLTYDWSETTQENVNRFGAPLVDEDELRSSLALLATACDDQDSH